uniref:uncharacterized protein LOC122602009 n=1 Tax=Erigeron canadensis TaxID=72917 RepID=UPI001CB99EEE|nr:uncharacterized protein LOC122602009 [Erigeron canadensis]
MAVPDPQYCYQILADLSLLTLNYTTLHYVAFSSLKKRRCLKRDLLAQIDLVGKEVWAFYWLSWARSWQGKLNFAAAMTVPRPPFPNHSRWCPFVCESKEHFCLPQCP